MSSTFVRISAELPNDVIDRDPEMVQLPNTSRQTITFRSDTGTQIAIQEDGIVLRARTRDNLIDLVGSMREALDKIGEELEFGLF